MRETCSNDLKGHPCSGQFSAETVLYNLYNCLELSSRELDLVVLSNIHVFTKTGKGIEVLDAASLIKQFQSVRRCCYIFTELAIPDFERLREHYQEHRIYPRTHGNTNRVPKNATSKKSLEAVHAFIDNYVEENAIVLPGRFPGFKSEEIRLLSSLETKMSVWREHKKTCGVLNERAVIKLQEIFTAVGPILS